MNRVSKRNKITLSNGDKISRQTFGNRITACKKRFVDVVAGDEFMGLRYCMALGQNVPRGFIDNSHIISVDRCIKIGKPELAYDLDNLQRESRKQHEIWDGGSIEQRMKQINFQIKMDYIELQDPGRFESMSVAVKSVQR